MTEQEFITRMEKNGREMRRIDKIFLFCGITCVVLNFFTILLEPMFLPLIARKFGYSGFGYSGAMASGLIIPELLVAAISLPISLLSSTKAKKWTTAALFLFLVRVLLLTLSYGFGVTGYVLLLGALPQCLCLREYDKLEYLKGQFGYPGFTPQIYMNTFSEKRARERERYKRSERNKEKRKDPAAMDGVESPHVDGYYEDIRTSRQKPPL